MWRKKKRRMWINAPITEDEEGEIEHIPTQVFQLPTGENEQQHYITVQNQIQALVSLNPDEIREWMLRSLVTNAHIMMEDDFSMSEGDPRFKI